MLFCSTKYVNHFMQKSFVTISFIFAFAMDSSAQTINVNSSSNKINLNPLSNSSFKKPVKANPFLAERIKPTKFELMHWPNYPLTAAQIEARNREWERRNKQTIGKQIASDIIKSYVNSLIYGKKVAVAIVPEF